MARLYDAGDGDSGCPGEDECPIFQSSAADQPPEARCPSCPKRAGGRRQTADGSELETRNSEPETFSEKQLLDRVERFRRERGSGRDVYPVLTGEEWEALLLFDDQHDAYRRAFDIRIAEGFALMAAVRY